MKILVCVKVINGEVNPFDESALECALRLSSDVTVVTMGPKSNEDVLKPLTRLGAKAVLISDTVYAGSDTLATAYILSEAIKKWNLTLFFADDRVLTEIQRRWDLCLLPCLTFRL